MKPLLDSHQQATLLVTVSVLAFLGLWSILVGVTKGSEFTLSWTFAVMFRRWRFLPLGFAALGSHIFEVPVGKGVPLWSVFSGPGSLWLLIGTALGAITAAQHPSGDRGEWPLRHRLQGVSLGIGWSGLIFLAIYDAIIARSFGGSATISWTFHLLGGQWPLFPLAYGVALGRVALVRWTPNLLTLDVAAGLAVLLFGHYLGATTAAQRPAEPKSKEEG